MRELWGLCRERGVEVEGEVAGVEGQESVETKVNAPAPAPASSGDDIPIANEDQAKEDDTIENMAAESVLAPSAPTSVPATQAHTQAQAQAPISPVQAPAAAVIPTQTSSSLASMESPSESVWLDRAIIGVIVALVLLILRRVANVDDL
jgi:ubiquitin-conjugating enzyme E2 J1